MKTTTIIILTFYFASAIGRGVKEIRLATGNWINCGGVNIGIKIQSGRNECIVIPKPQIFGNSIATWSGTQLGNCASFNVDENSRAYFQTDSRTDGFCPDLMQIYMDDRVNTRYHARGNYYVGYYTNEHNDYANGMTKEWPRNGHYIRPQEEPLLCPRANVDTCPLSEMYAYRIASRDRKNCLFECTTVASVSKTTNYHDTIETGFRCVDVNYDSIQFDWCCKTKSTEDGIPHCRDVTTGSSNHPRNQTGTPVEVEVPSRPVAVPGECPQSGCPIRNVKTYYDANVPRAYEICEIRFECGYVSSADPYDSDSGMECTRTNSPRRKALKCCNDPTALSALPQCSAVENRNVPPHNDETAVTNTEYDDDIQSQAPTSDQGSLADGCPNDGFPSQNHETIENPPDSAIGAVRCCQDSGQYGSPTHGSQCVTPDNPCRKTTFESAKRICNLQGKRICKREELSGGNCCGTGCRFDGELVWQIN